MKAKKAEITNWKAIDIECEEDRLGLTGSPTQVVRIFTPPPRAKGEIFEGDPEASVNKLDDQFYATPAFGDGRIYLRGVKSLYCIGPER